jgi:valyl-tRNA synthetase
MWLLEPRKEHAQAMGASIDWTRERSELDEGTQRAAREAFVTLYHEGLLYRGPTPSGPWLVKMSLLNQPAIAALQQGKTKFVPEPCAQTCLRGLEATPDWCISSPTEGGPRVPVWTCGGCSSLTVAREVPSACSACGASAPTQDEHWLDPSFTCAIGPFSTLGWPEKTREIRTFFPVSVIVADRETLPLGIARMLMLGLHLVKKVPFRTVYVHASVQPSDRAQDDGVPVLGADALRFALVGAAGPEPRFEAHRRFVETLWDTTHAALGQLQGLDPDRFADVLAGDPRDADLSLADRWILSRLQRTSKDVDEALETFRFRDAAEILYRFCNTELCDQYRRRSEPVLKSWDPADPSALRRRELAQGTFAHCLETALRLLHPFMPFVTEELWQALPRPTGVPASIMITLYPMPDDRWVDDEAEREMAHRMVGEGTVQSTPSEGP